MIDHEELERWLGPPAIPLNPADRLTAEQRIEVEEWRARIKRNPSATLLNITPGSLASLLEIIDQLAPPPRNIHNA